ncbi:MAG: carboxypeptidase regulatory-like domain-containing protein [Luteitalea sp.]|nr:carboxypeptidase regulatory-like domain-containing protein [Luteitalea sp.]
MLCTAVLHFVATSAADAQNIVGQIAGTVRDSSGAVLPGVTVTIRNINTGLERTEVTASSGAYVVTNLPIGAYDVTAELEGFGKAERTGFDLTADGRITADFTLSVGALTENVQVQAVLGETVNRTSGEIGRVIDGDQVRELALSGRNYMELISLIPGAVQLDDDQMALTTSLSTGGTVINGSRGNSNNLNVDGGFNLDSGSNGSQINNVGIDFIEQVSIKTSNFSAEYGRNSGASVNVVTKSGTNQFRGSVFETYRDESLDAAAFLAPRDESGKRIKGQLEFNDFGGSLGGPILHNKLFFFAGQEYKSLDRVDGPTRRSLPTTAELRGDFSARISEEDDEPLIDPLTGEPFPGNVIPQDRITPEGRAIVAAYDAMIGQALQYDDEPTGNNATYQLDFPFDWRQDILRLDYRANDAHSFYVRYLHDKYDLVEPRGTFINAQLPTIPTNRVRPGYSYLAAHTWVISEDLVHEAKINASWNGQRIPPVGDAWRRDTYGFDYPQVFDGGRYDDGIPNIDMSGLANLTGPSQSLLSPTTDITAQNTLTWLKGAHSVRTGFLVTRNRKDQNGRSGYTGNVNFNTSGNPNTTGQAFADALLGNFRTYTEVADDPIGFFRFTQYGAFISDNWRLRPNLSVEVGLRYELSSPIYTQANNVANFDPALYDPAQAVTVLPDGTLLSGSGNRFNGLIRAGDEVPEDQQDRVTLDPEATALIPTGAPRGLYDTHHLWMPRFSAAYSLNETTVIRGGAGLFYDRPEGNIIFSSVNLPPFLPSVSVENGNLADPLGGTPSEATPLSQINTIDPNLEIPRQLNFSVSVQRELPFGHFFEVAYVGNRGRNLLWQPDINQPTFEVLAANAEIPSDERPSTNSLRPFQGYSQIRERRSNAFVNYNALQLYLNKRRGDVKYSVSYTLSKAEGTARATGNGANPEDPFNQDFNFGPTDYDRRHVLVTTWTYSLPWLRDRRDVVGAVVGGWEASGKMRWQSGQYLTPTGSTSIGGRRADYLGGEIDLASSERDEDRWFNTDAFAEAPDDRRGTATVGVVEGPHRYTWDVSMRKYFNVTSRVRLQLRADVFNVFNRVNFNNPNVNATAGEYGQISSTRPPRQSQLSVRLEF